MTTESQRKLFLRVKLSLTQHFVIILSGMTCCGVFFHWPYILWSESAPSPKLGTALSTGSARESIQLMASREFELSLCLLYCEGPAVLVGAAEVCAEFILNPASSPVWSCAARGEPQTQTRPTDTCQLRLLGSCWFPQGGEAAVLVWHHRQ